MLVDPLTCVLISKGKLVCWLAEVSKLVCAELETENVLLLTFGNI